MHIRHYVINSMYAFINLLIIDWLAPPSPKLQKRYTFDIRLNEWYLIILWETK